MAGILRHAGIARGGFPLLTPLAACLESSKRCYWLWQTSGWPEWAVATLRIAHLFVLPELCCSCYVTAVFRATAERIGGHFEALGTDQPGDSLSNEIRQLAEAKAINLPKTLAQSFARSL